MTTILPLPNCRTAADGGRPLFDDGAPRTWTDSVNGEPRAACVFKPTGLDAGSTRPLVVFLHGSGGTASTIYDSTLLRQKAASWDLTGDPARPGFVLVADQGRNLPSANGNLGPEERHDIYFRDFSAPSRNPDFRNLDRLVDELVAEGGIDTNRIYVMGWSNGAFFGQLWGMARHVTPTPGGHRVAAAVAYAGADPLQNLSATQSPSCALASPPMTSLPIYSVVRNCDSAVGCDAAQQTQFMMPPGYDVAGWVARLRGALGNNQVTQLIVDSNGVQRLGCSALGCGQLAGLVNHVRWPDGVADQSGRDWEPTMLDFLKAHPLP